MPPCALAIFRINYLAFLENCVLPLTLSDQSVPKYAPKITKLKGLPDKVRYSQPSEGGIDSLLAIGAGEDDSYVRSNAQGLFKNLPA
jgi:hypothetical protein